MGILDSIIEAVSPERALRRQAARKQLLILNSGYSNYGASRTKKQMMSWMDAGGSSREDIEDNLPTLRRRSRDLYMGVPIATSALKIYRTSVVGEGLSLKPKIDAEALHITEEQAAVIEENILREWNLWADSTDCDAARLSNFYELQQLALLNWLMSGDVLTLLPVFHRPGSVYDLHINMVEADRCYTPPGKEGDEHVVSGVERNDLGEVVAYHICSRHPLGRESLPEKWTRVEATGTETGRRNVLHIMNRERIGQVRGVPLLAPVIESLKQIGRYTESELTAAVTSSFATFFLESSEQQADVPIGEVIPEEAQIDRYDDTTIEVGPGAVVALRPGEKANMQQPGRPNANFEGFINAISKEIGAALELPQELLMRQFTESYSASRGALLEAWKAFDMYRDWLVSGFCQPIYEEWLCEAVAKGRVNAPGFWADPAIRKCYTNAEWYGPSRGQLDPVKEVNAAILRVNSGLSTATKEAMELTGTDFRDNMEQAKKEQAMLRDAGLSVSVTAQQDDGEGNNGDNKEGKE